MAGIRLDRLRLHRVLLIALNLALFIWLYRHATITMALVYFIAIFTARYLFLFGSFVKDGIADRLTRRYGEERGYQIYETITSCMFFHGGGSFSCLAKTTTWMGLSLASVPSSLLVDIGMILSLVGLTTNIWSALVIGLDTYYYKDLFIGRFIGEFKQAGPYRWLKNPMYGLGQCAAYGTALTNLSTAGVIATLLNQGMMYLFYFTIEKPHIVKILSRTPFARQEEKFMLPAEERPG
jgi:protein-S-isoprenylcysteine O-methyltransferase Ste14